MTDFSFTEQAPHEVGFAQVFDDKIAPYLREMETLRHAAVRKAMQRVKLGAVLVVILSVWAGLAVHPAFGLFPAFFGGAIVLFIFLSRGQKIGNDVAKFLRPILSAFLGNMRFHETVPESFIDLDTLRNLQVLRKTDRTHQHLALDGVWQGIPYKVIKVECTDQVRDTDGDRRTDARFSGIVLEIDCPRPMPRVVFLPDFGETLNKVFKWATRSLLPEHRWDLKNAELERIFEVYTDDIAQAEQDVTPEFAHCLVTLANRFQDSQTSCAAAFDNRSFYLALRLPHGFMEFNAATTPLGGIDAQIRAAMQDLLIPRQVIEALRRAG